MSLEWLVATIRPSDILGSRTKKLTDIQEFAAVVTGQHWRLDRQRLEGYLADDVNEESSLSHWAVQLTQEPTISSAFAYASRVLPVRQTDSWSVSLSLLAATAAAELEEFDRALEILERQLSRLDPDANGDDQVLRCALMLQLGLRSRDAGQPFEEWYEGALRSADQVHVTECTGFATESSDRSGYVASIEELLAAFRDAALGSRRIDSFPIADRRERQIRGIDTLQRIMASEADQLSTFLRRTFENSMKSSVVRIGASADADLYHTLLALELLGHPRVYGARRELSAMRFVKAASGASTASQLADSIRLMRHAGASKELGLALRWLRTGGPLEALSRAARLIIRSAPASNRLRVVELQVLEATAELLAATESDRVLNVILENLQAGPPVDLPSHWQAETVRYEAAWKAAASLADGAQATDRVASYLCDVANELLDRPDELLDRALARAINRLNWEQASAEVRGRWTSWIGRARDHEGSVLASSQSVMAAVLDLGVSEEGISTPPGLEHIIAALNSFFRKGRAVPPSAILLSSQTVDVIIRELRKIQDQASRGMHSFGGLSPADVAAGVIDSTGVDELWPELAVFLLDSRVARDDKSAAFERLARSTRPLPQETRSQFSASAVELLEQTMPSVFDRDVVPYPAALRFLSAHLVIPDDYALSCVARLAGSLDPKTREEAAATLSLLTRRLNYRPSWLLPLAIQLSYDSDVEVRARAAHALTAFATVDSEGHSAANRLADLLSEDGLSLPVQILGGMQREDVEALDARVREAIFSLAEDHPSRAIRSRATDLMEAFRSASM